MKEKWMLAGLLAAAVGIMTGCSGGEGQNNKDSNEAETTKGRYVEEECSLPDEIGRIMDLAGTGGQNVRMVADTGVYDSADGGRSWQACSEISEEKARKITGGISCAAVSSTGDIAAAYMDGQNANVEILTGDRESGPVEVGQAVITSVMFSGEEDVAAVDVEENIMMVDMAAETSVNIIPADDGQRTGIACIGDQILVQSINSAQLYDKKGSSLQTDEVLISLVKENKQQPGISGARNSLIASQPDGKGLFYCSRKGLYSYRLGGTTAEQLIDGSMTSIGSPKLYFTGMAAKEDGSVLVSYMDGNGKPLLKNYVYSESADTVQGKELTVYSLYDDPVLRQAVTMYNSNNADSYAHLVIGTDGSGAVTGDDAVKTLNTEILAGKGPDVLILDGLPIDTYIENGMLADMEEILNDIEDTDGLFENVAGAYEADGRICAVPTRFLVSVVAGRSEIVEQIIDLKTMGEQISRIREHNTDAGSAVGMLDGMLLEKLFHISAGAWIRADGTLDEAKLREFLQEAKEIQDGQIKDADKAQVEAINNYWDGLDTFLEVLAPFSDLQMGRKELAYAELGSVYNLNQLLAAQNGYKIVYKTATGQTENTFIPKSIAGINVRSGRQPEAEQFIKMLLGADVQSMTSIDRELGFPVNRAAFDKTTDNPHSEEQGGGMAAEAAGEDASGNQGEDLPEWPEKSEYSEFISILEKLDNPSVTDDVIKKIVIEAGTAYLKEETSLDEASERIKSQISIYLAE